MYTIVGGKPYTGYTGTISFSGLYVVGTTESYEEVENIVRDNFEECGGLIIVLYNGMDLEYDENGKHIRPVNV